MNILKTVALCAALTLALAGSALAQGNPPTWPTPAPPGATDDALLRCTGADDLTQVAWDWDCLNSGCLAAADATWQGHWYDAHDAFNAETDRLAALEAAALEAWNAAIYYRDNVSPPGHEQWAQMRVDAAHVIWQNAVAAYNTHVASGWAAFYQGAIEAYEAEFCSCECWIWWPIDQPV
tara:strand:- start:6916 stop:7452 length:537 start_codon:yes stop_codon:yes gene_type:complete